jgi:hypothetical protein
VTGTNAFAWTAHHWTHGILETVDAAGRKNARTRERPNVN